MTDTQRSKRKSTGFSPNPTKKSKVQSDSDDDIEIVAVVSPTNKPSFSNKVVGKKRQKATLDDDDEIVILSPPKKHSKPGTSFSRSTPIPARRSLNATRSESKARK